MSTDGVGLSASLFPRVSDSQCLFLCLQRQETQEWLTLDSRVGINILKKLTIVSHSFVVTWHFILWIISLLRYLFLRELLPTKPVGRSPRGPYPAGLSVSLPQFSTMPSGEGNGVLYSPPSWGAAPPCGFYLEILKGGAIIGTHELVKDHYTFGRAQDSVDVACSHPSVSRLVSLLPSVWPTFSLENVFSPDIYDHIHSICI